MPIVNNTVLHTCKFVECKFHIRCSYPKQKCTSLVLLHVLFVLHLRSFCLTQVTRFTSINLAVFFWVFHSFVLYKIFSFFYLEEGQPFCSIQTFNWLAEVHHIREGNLLFSVSWFKGLSHEKQRHQNYRNIRIMLITYLG